MPSCPFRSLFPRLQFFAALISALVAHGADLPPISAFTAPPEIRLAKISPDGGAIAFVGGSDRADSFAILDVTTMAAKSVGGAVRGLPIEDFWWKGPDRLVVKFAPVLFQQNFQILNLKTGKRELNTATAQIATIVSLLPADPDHILFTDSHDNLKKLDLKTGKSQTVEKRVNDAGRWLVSNDGQVVGAWGRRDKDWLLFTRVSGDQQWRRIELGSGSEPDFFPIGVARDRRRILGLDRVSADNGRFVARDLATHADELLCDTAPFDPDFAVTWGDDMASIRGISFQSDRRQIRYFAEDDAVAARMIDAALAGRTNWIVSVSIDQNRLIIKSESESIPPSFYLLDRSARKLSALGSAYSSLQSVSLGSVRYFQFKGTDGFELSAKLLSPAGSRQPPPLLVYTGSDPSTRDFGEFQPHLQLLANRGYAVLAVNHRGVDGFGKKYSEAGAGQVDGLAADDLAAAVAYVAKNEWCDGKRVAVFGQDGGGLIGLYALTRHPDAFAAWINFDTPLSTESFSLDQGILLQRLLYGMWRVREGFILPLKHELSGDFGEELTPITQLKKVRVPSFHYYQTWLIGRPFNDGSEVKATLEKMGLPVTFLMPPARASAPEWAEGYRVAITESHRRMEELLKFLATYLPPAGQTSPASTPAK